MNVSVLITAAGRSRRMGTGPKKEYRLINGISVLEHITALFLEMNYFHQIAVTCPPGETSRFEELLEDYRSETLRIVEGGPTRQASVYRGLSALARPEPATEDTVLIHDAARPWVTPRLIRQTAELAAAQGSALPVVPPVNAMKRMNSRGLVTEHLCRETTGGAQTPQGFRFRPILDAHRRAAEEGRTDFIDDSEIYHTYIGPVQSLPGEPENVKITYPSDLPPEGSLPE